MLKAKLRTRISRSPLDSGDFFVIMRMEQLAVVQSTYITTLPTFCRKFYGYA